MKKEQVLHRHALFLLLLPLFFVLHGYVTHFGFVPETDALLLFGLYALSAMIITGISWLIFRNLAKAALFATAIMILHLFFGSIHDFLKSVMPGAFITRYAFIIPLLLILLSLFFIYLKRSKSNFQKFTFYLNTLLIIFLVIDIGSLIMKIAARKETTGLPEGFTHCTDCPKPDIYFILADEYAGPTALDSVFGFNDSVFIKQLGELGFTTAHASTSNYNYTPFALASILDMEYLKLSGTGRGKTELSYCYRKIRDNRTLQFLESQGYAFYNYSVFDFKGQPARTRETFLPAKTRLITAQTFLSRFDRDIRFNLVTKLKSKSNLRIITYANLKNNNHIIELTKEIAAKKTTHPKFIYSHLMMPHYPYYFDSAGKEQPFETLVEGNQVNQKAYISYLQYTNKKLLDLISHVKKTSANPPLIILMSDHGFRHFITPVKEEYYFQNLLSVHYPPGLKTPRIDSLSGVNVFRTIFNSVFKQQQPLLKDSTIYLAD